MKAVLRPITTAPRIRDRSVVRPSVISGDEMLMLRVAADVGERQDDDREGVAALFFPGSMAQNAVGKISEPVLSA